MPGACKIAANHNHRAIWEATSMAFERVSAEWGKIGLDSIDSSFLESVATAIADTVATVK
jgi:hypothetical protein